MPVFAQEFDDVVLRDLVLLATCACDITFIIAQCCDEGCEFVHVPITFTLLFNKLSGDGLLLDITNHFHLVAIAHNHWHNCAIRLLCQDDYGWRHCTAENRYRYYTDYSQ